MIDDEERCYRAVSSRDARFDGWFFVGVTSTGIFCRPSCPATTPRRANVRFYPTAAAAQHEGFRACRRCRPDTAPGSPEWNVRGDLASRAMRLIDDGLVDREGVGGVARRLAVSERHLHRILVAELGASPLALARSRRAQTARVLIETTALPFTEIAFAAGFASIRQFNDTVRRSSSAPAPDRAARRPHHLDPARPVGRPPPAVHDGAGPTPISLRLATRGALRRRRGRRLPGGAGDPGRGGGRRRRHLPPGALAPHGPAIVALPPAADHVSRRPRPGRPAGPRTGRRAVPPPARPRRRSPRRRRGARRRPLLAPLVAGHAGPPLPGCGRRHRAPGAGDHRPAGLGGRRPHGGRAGAAALGEELPGRAGRGITRGADHAAFPRCRNDAPGPIRPRSRCPGRAAWP